MVIIRVVRRNILIKPNYKITGILSSLILVLGFYTEDENELISILVLTCRH